MHKQLLVATRNKGKLLEIKATLTEFELEVLGLDDIPNIEGMPEVEEPAQTFEGNAIIKAMTYGHRLKMLTLAEDAGLEVDALDGRPGVYSARYVKSEADRCPKMLEEMKDVPEGRRGAQFVAVMAIFDPDTEKIRFGRGFYQGRIIHEMRGTNGFGFDPIFYNEDLGKTNAEMSKEEKNSVSHRGKALKQIVEVIRAEFMEN